MYTFAFWTIFYFGDIYNYKDINALRISFGVGKDFYSVIQSIFSDFKR